MENAVSRIAGPCDLVGSEGWLFSLSLVRLPLRQSPLTLNFHTVMKKILASVERRYHLWRGVRRFRGELAVGRVSELAIHEMWLGWGNYGWSASPALVQAACEQAMRQASRNVLELGSGLTTLALGLVAQHLGNRVISIDHDADWSVKLQSDLAGAGITSVTVECRALRKYGDFDWYESDQFPDLECIGLVLVDGPPGTTHGGRRGVLEILAARLPYDAHVILDDVNRDDEWRLASEWATSRAFKMEVYRTAHTRAFAHLTPRG